MNNNTTRPQPSNHSSTGSDLELRINKLTYLIATFSITWTIVANLFIIGCFVRNRRRRWTSFSRQAFSMTISDLLVGLTGVPLLVIEQNEGRANGFLCFATFYLFFSIQSVTLYHVLGICIFRNINLKTFSDPIRKTGQFAFVTGLIITSWAAPLLVMLVLFALRSTNPYEVQDCYIETIFGSHVHFAMVYVGATHVVSQCLTNLMYMVTCVRLWYLIKKIVPVRYDSFTLGNTSSNNEQACRTTNNGSLGSNPLSPTSSEPSTSTLRSQKSVIITIGILLLMFNLFTMPLTATLFVLKSAPISRNVRFVVCTLFAINSGLNPIVYATRITSLREAVKKVFREMYNVLRF